MNKQQNLLIHFHKEGLFLVLKNTKISDYILEEKSQQLPVMNRIHQEINNSKRILNCILQVQLRHQVHGRFFLSQTIRCNLRTLSTFQGHKGNLLDNYEHFGHKFQPFLF